MEIMNLKEISSFALIIIGGFLSILTVLPVISDFLPIAIFNSSIYNITFGGLLINGVRGAGRDSSFPKSWTVLGLPPMLMFLIFVTLGSLAILIVLVQPDKIVKKPITGLTSLVIGILELFVLLLILLGNVNDLNHFGLSPYSQGFGPGLGYFVLVLSTILIIVGGISNFVIVQRAGINGTTTQKDSFPFMTYVRSKVKGTISKKEYSGKLSERTMKMMEEIINENTVEGEK